MKQEVGAEFKIHKNEGTPKTLFAFLYSFFLFILQLSQPFFLSQSPSN